MCVHELWQGISRTSRRRLEPSSQSTAATFGYSSGQRGNNRLKSASARLPGSDSLRPVDRRRWTLTDQVPTQPPLLCVRAKALESRPQSTSARLETGIDVWAKRVGLLRSTSVNSMSVTRVVMARSGDATTMFRAPSGKSATAVGRGHRYFPAEDQTPGCTRSNMAGLCACATETQATTTPIAINLCMSWFYGCNLTARR